jgi:phage tail P2-like protein
MDKRLIPDGIRDERAERLLALLDAWDEIPLERALVYRVSEAGPDALRQLAWQFHVMGVEGWGLAITRDQRERLVSRAMELHRYKGTPWAVRRALEALGLDAEIVEWFQAGADDLDPYEFGLRATISEPIEPGVLLNADTADRLRPTIDAFKSARSHLAWIAFAVRLQVPVDAPAVTDSRRVRRAFELPVYILPTFDTWRLDDSGLDPRPVVQSRSVRVRTDAAVRLGRVSTLDRALPLDGMIPGQSMDLWLPHREGERVPPLASVRSDVRASAAAAAAGAVATRTIDQRIRTTLGQRIEIDRSAVGRAASAAAVNRPVTRGLDAMPAMDATTIDTVPLDHAMETLNV